MHLSGLLCWEGGVSRTSGLATNVKALFGPPRISKLPHKIEPTTVWKLSVRLKHLKKIRQCGTEPLGISKQTVALEIRASRTGPNSLYSPTIEQMISALTSKVALGKEAPIYPLYCTSTGRSWNAWQTTNVITEINWGKTQKGMQNPRPQKKQKKSRCHNLIVKKKQIQIKQGKKESPMGRDALKGSVFGNNVGWGWVQGL